MVARFFPSKYFWLPAGVLLASVLHNATASAQVASAGGEDPLAILSPGKAAERNLNDKPSRDYTGLPLGGWLLYPSVLAGAVYDDNLFQSSTNRVASTGVNIAPSFLADRDTGIHHTTLYANGNINLYPDISGGNTVNLITGFRQVWEAQRDLVLRVSGEYDRRTDMYNNGVVVSPLTGQALGVFASPQRYNVFTGSASALKSFDRFFVGLAGTVTGTTYDTLYTTTGPTSQSYRDDVVYAVDARFGYKLTPIIYAFSQATGNFRVFDDPIYNSEGYRVEVGLGTDRISLFRGEIYAGYQRQIYDYAPFGAPDSPVYGCKVYWYPTKAWTVSASLDETYQDSGLTTVGNLTGSAAHVTAAALNVNYVMSRWWNASIQGGYSDISYIDGGRHDHRWSAGATLNYQIMRNLDATFRYNLADVQSNVSGGSFVRNQFTLGGTYKY